ncbi:hypothetical protein BSG1_07489 [Bacillus sp. SG-1]|nr:hypothetical protein BSG1_07489 [Bacillus sp. SG-1]
MQVFKLQKQFTPYVPPSIKIKKICNEKLIMFKYRGNWKDKIRRKFFGFILVVEENLDIEVSNI